VNTLLGLHLRPGSFSDRWVAYCREREVPFREVDPFRSDIMQQVESLKAFAWHWSHEDPKAALMARQVTYALEAKGLAVFPNSATCWHFDDKVGQKYLLEAIGAPVPKTWVFYDLRSALEWIDATEFPKVFKLRGGAGSANVRLVKNRRAARALCDKAFSSGFPAAKGYFHDARTNARRTESITHLLAKLRRAPGEILQSVRSRQLLPRSRGYILFQEFLPRNSFDTRVTVIGNRAFGYTRANRPSDFRASGSGANSYSPDAIDSRCVDVAFRVSGVLKAQSLAFDFLQREDRPIIVEISYGYVSDYVHRCPGHWDSAMNWHEGQMWPEDGVLEDLLDSLS
jgi:glutathione synthase/RimK-type ligase-like ATP-grasp enzyme